MGRDRVQQRPAWRDAFAGGCAGTRALQSGNLTSVRVMARLVARVSARGAAIIIYTTPSKY